MKKTLLSSALLLGLTSAAQAQNVTLYGIIDIGYQYTRHNADDQARTTRSALESGQQSGSRWGIKGSEDLGSGNTVNFMLENGFSADTGAEGASGVAFSRLAWLGVANKDLGELRLGRQKTASSEFFELVDPFIEGLAPSAITKVFVSTGQRSNNMIKYHAPSLLDNRLSVALNYSTATGGTDEKAGSSNNMRLAAIAVKYQDDALYLAATYDNVNYADSKDTDNGSENFWQIGGYYDFDKSSLKLPFKLHAAYGNNGSPYFTKGPSNKVLAEVKDSANAWMLGVSIPVMGGTLFTSHYRASDWDVNSSQIGYNYPLSKRTNLYTYFVSSQGLDSNANVIANSNNFEDVNNNRVRRFGLGMRHRF